MHATPRRPLRGFTLVELLVVIAIIGLISAVALPVVLPALNERRVSESARILQAVLSGTRDAAIRANAPRGIRLLPDPIFGFAAGQPLASNRFIAIEPAPDYSEGVVAGGTFSPVPAISSSNGYTATYLRVASSEFITASNGATILNAPTGWQFNIRQGDKIRFNDSGGYYTVAGPIHGNTVANNPERYIWYQSLANETNPSLSGDLPSFINNALPREYLNLTNGIDDDGDGWIDESCDGIDNDGDGIIDPGFNGIDDDGMNGIDDPTELFLYLDPTTHQFSLAGSEYEQEVFTGVETTTKLKDVNYVISRRPVASPNAAETTLPAGVVIDLTTWNAAAATPPLTNGVSYPPLLPERSRLPVDPFSGYVDILIDQTGRVVPPGAGSGGGGYYANSPIASLPFYHFWITEREGVVAPLWDPRSFNSNTTPYVPTLNPNHGLTATSQNYFLPMPQGTPGYLPMPDGLQQAYSANPVYLNGERRLVTLFTKTGQIVANSIELFNVNDTSQPYYAAQSGTKESQ